MQLLVIVGKEERRLAAVLVICPYQRCILRLFEIWQAPTVRICRECAQEKSAGRSLLDFFQAGNSNHCVPVGPKNENFNSGRSVLALKITLSFPARADWIRLDRSRAVGFRGGIWRTIGCLQALFPVPPPPLPHTLIPLPLSPPPHPTPQKKEKQHEQQKQHWSAVLVLHDVYILNSSFIMGIYFMILNICYQTTSGKHQIFQPLLMSFTSK